MYSRIYVKGSSSSGLLTATAIFAGLLFYANQVGFQSAVEDSETAVTGSTDSIDESTMAQAPQLVEIPRGIFNTPTISAEQIQAVEQKPAIKSRQTESASAPVNVSLNQPSVESESTAGPMSVTAIDQTMASGQSFVVYPHSDAEIFDGWHAIQAQQAAAANLAGRHHGRGYASSRGRGTADGQGEFALSINLRSRARMDADVGADSDVVARSAADAYYRQHQLGYAQPYLNYYRAY